MGTHNICFCGEKYPQHMAYVEKCGEKVTFLVKNGFVRALAKTFTFYMYTCVYVLFYVCHDMPSQTENPKTFFHTLGTTIKAVTMKSYASQREKTYLLILASNEDADQPAHPRNLISLRYPHKVIAFMAI